MMTFTLADIFSGIYRAADTLPIESFAESLRFGNHPSQFKGDGHDFDRKTEYDPHVHSVSQIDWRSLTRDQVFVREYRVTKDFPVIVMADLSTSMAFGVDDQQHKERMLLEVIGDIGLACFHAQDPMGFIGFAEEIIFSEFPKRGEDQVYYLIEQLYEFFSGLQSDSRGKLERKRTDFYAAFDHLTRTCADKKHLIIVISDFVGSQNFLSYEKSELEYLIRSGCDNLGAYPDLGVLADIVAQHEMVFIFLDDPREFEANEGYGYVRIEDMETGKQQIVSRRKMLQLAHEIRQKRRMVRKVLQMFGINSVVLEYGKHFQRLYRFFIGRQESFGTQ